MTALVLIGAGGSARDTLDVVDACNRERPGTFDALGFVSEVESDWSRVLNDRPVLGGFEWFATAPRGVRVVCAVGSPALRHRLAASCRELGLAFASVIHPRAEISPYARLGDGVVVGAGVVITNRATIGDHAQVNIGTTIAHDAEVGEFATLAPGVRVSGNVTIGAGCDLGTGAVVIHRRGIGEWSVVGAGAAVTEDLPANCTAVGVPARVIKTRPDGWWNAPR